MRSADYPPSPMIRGERSIEIGASLEAVFAVASDLERYPEWQDFLNRVEVRVAWRSEKGDLKALSGAFDLVEAGPGRTRATFGLEVDPGFKLGLLLKGPVADSLRDRILQGMLDGLKTRAEQGG